MPAVMTKQQFIARHRAENDRYIPAHESLAAYQEFLRLTGPAVFTSRRQGIVFPDSLERDPLPSEVRCTYCRALGRGERCRNCGAARGV